MKKKISGVLSSALAAILLFAAIPITRVSAVSYEGKGTKSSPYLVETAQQLMGISDKLSAHYKLNNTIDLSGVNFEPIGCLATPFTGSFTCDTDSDGTPKYAIKNVNLKGVTFNSLAQQNAAYKNDKTNKWEIGIFRATNNATIKNILVIDGTASGGIIGESWQNSDYTFNKGIDQQGVGLLVGYALNSTFEGCAVQGKINANGAAGLFAGVLKSCNVTKCYATGEVVSSGKWCVGGFAGSIETNSSIKNCFFEGSVNATRNLSPSAFAAIGKASSAENCYFSGSVTPSCSFGGEDDGTGSKLNNCQMSPINIGVTKITNLAKYVPHALSNTAQANNSATNGGTDTKTESQTDSGTETAAASKMTAEEFSKKLLEYEPSQIKGWSLDDALGIIALKTDYANMSAEESAKVQASDLTLMNTLYDSAVVIVIKDLTEAIDKLPSADKITAKNSKAALKVCEQFNSLPEDVQKMFNSSRIKKVKAVYEKAKAMQDVQIVDQTVNASASSAEKILIILLVVINTALLGTAVTLAVLVIKKIMKPKEEKLKILKDQ